MTIPQKWLNEFQAEEKEYNAWLNGETMTMPVFVNVPINEPEKLEAYCQMTEERIREGVIFDGKRIVEILPWD